MNAQLELFFVPSAKSWTQEDYWASLGYDGPEPGRFCSIDRIIVELEGGGSIYAYMEQCRLIEKRPDGRWLAVIEMGIVHGAPWGKDGTLVILSVDEIWPPMRRPTERRNDIKIGI